MWLSGPDLKSGLAFYRARLGPELIWRTGQAVGLGMPDAKTEIVPHTGGQEPEVE